MTSSTDRVASAAVDELFLHRWSPRSFEDRPVAPADLESLFEAARWTPSCYNEQPWLFVYGREAEDHARVAATLVDGNRTWAEKAPVLGIVFAKRHFAANGKENRWAPFDAGAASMALALQAHKLGLITHFMGGIHADRAHEMLGVPDTEWEAMAGFALGYRGPVEALPENLREREQPSDRKPRSDVAHEGRFQG